MLQYEEKYDHMHFQRIRQWRKRGRTAVIQEAWNSFYDKEILARVAEESDMSEEFVKNHEENAVYSHIINVPIGHRFPGVDTEEIMTPEKLFMIQAHVIHELAAENESCIFVGRCADVVLKDHENCYSFFIHSPLEVRIKRIVETEHDDRTTSEEDDQANRLGEIFLS